MYGDRLKELRLDKKLKQKDIAQFLGISRQAYGKYELGLRQPDYDILIKLANYYDVSTDYILGKSNVKNIEKYINNFKGYPEQVIRLIDNICSLISNHSDSGKIQNIKTILRDLDKII